MKIHIELSTKNFGKVSSIDAVLADIQLVADKYDMVVSADIYIQEPLWTSD